MADDREDVFSKVVRAGKRTYFFDVKSTRGKDLFLTITESKKHTQEDGSAHYEKHKIFLYKEDFDKFLDGLHDSIAEIDRLKGSGDFMNGPSPMPDERSTEGEQPNKDTPPDAGTSFNDLDFEDLGRKDI